MERENKILHIIIKRTQVIPKNCIKEANITKYFKQASRRVTTNKMVVLRSLQFAFLFPSTNTIVPIKPI